MAPFSWLPLELWRAGALAQETKAAITMYEDLANSGDAGALSSLRSSIETRIDALEAFYIRSSDDERAVLFEKQRLKLRKLLHEYDQYAATVAQQQQQEGGEASSAHAGDFGPASPSATSASRGGDTLRGTIASAAGRATGAAPAASSSGGVSTKVIREDTRLTLPELTAWFEQAGSDEMPEVTPGIVSRVFHSITRTNSDGKLSIRDLRQWYITFGRHTLAAAAAAGHSAEDALEGSSSSTPASAASASIAAGGTSIVSVPVMASLNVKLATTATKGIVGGKFGAGAGKKGAATASAAAAKQLYSWEGGESTPASASASASSTPAPSGEPSYDSLPNGLLELQVRLTPEEFAAVGRLRRALDAEARYRARMEAAQSKAAARRGATGGPTGASGFGWDGSASGLSIGGGANEREAYSEPLTRDAAAIFSRSS